MLTFAICCRVVAELSQRADVLGVYRLSKKEDILPFLDKLRTGADVLVICCRLADVE